MYAHNAGPAQAAELTQSIAALRALFERAADEASRLSAVVSRALESEALGFGPAERGCRVRLPGLTPRESDVLDLVLDGLSSKEIARRLGISRATARCHVQNILTKLGVYSRTQAAALATESAAATGPVAVRAGSAAAARLESLTPRETEVLRALAGGMEKREIAEHLVLSPHTVRTHIQRVLAKLGVHSVLGAMAVARKAGVTPLPPRTPERA
ncbi:MAG TPA: LuxR C-terminal-related transcriptional regulator [Actinospica sp.]|nr:LuxR C-terminal-related transcriptional regulator [Actinospica sp.]